MNKNLNKGKYSIKNSFAKKVYANLYHLGYSFLYNGDDLLYFKKIAGNNIDEVTNLFISYTSQLSDYSWYEQLIYD